MALGGLSGFDTKGVTELITIFLDMRKTSFGDLFRLPELLLLLVLPVMPFGWSTLVLIGSWLLHVWLRQDALHFPSFGSWFHVIITIVCWLVIAFILHLLAGSNNQVAEKPGFGELLTELTSMLALGPLAILAFMVMVIFIGAQLLFWTMGVRHLWRMRGRVKKKVK